MEEHIRDILEDALHFMNGQGQISRADYDEALNYIKEIADA